MFLKNNLKKMIFCRKIFMAGVVLFAFYYVALPVYAEEKNSDNVIKLAASNWPPYIYKDKNGNAKGLHIDILSEVFEKEMGLKLEYKELPWKRAQLNVQSGQADVLLTVPTGERLMYAEKSSRPVYELFLYVYTYKAHPRLKEINEITSGMDIKKLGIIPVTNRGNSWHEMNIDSYGVKTYYVTEEDNAFNMLAHRRADITIEPLYAGSYIINKLKLASKIVPTKARFGPILFHLLVSKKSQHIKKMDQINEVLEKLKVSGRLQEILNKYAVIE